jgi:rod shape-determining protein MreD
VTLYLVVPLLVAVAVLQATVIVHLTVWGVHPDLPLLVVASWGALRGPREGAVWGFIAGVVVDLLSGAPFGAATLSLTVVGLLAGLGRSTVFRARLVLLLATAFLGTIVYDLIFMAVLTISGRTVVWLDALLRIIMPSALINAALIPLLYWLMRSLHRLINRGDMEL